MIVLFSGVCACAFAGARVCIHPMPFYQLHIVRERLCLFKNKFLKWFLRDLSQQRGQEKSIIPPSFTLPLFPQLSSHLPSAPSHLYLGAPSRFCSLSASSVLDSFVRWPPLPQQVRYLSENKRTFAFILPPMARRL